VKIPYAAARLKVYVKVKLKLFLCLIKHCAMKAYGEMYVQINILSSALVVGVISFTPLPLYPRYLLDRWLSGPQSRTGRGGEDKILDPTGTLTPIPLSSSP
jgi:hypothetical protein